MRASQVRGKPVKAIHSHYPQINSPLSPGDSSTDDSDKGPCPGFLLLLCVEEIYIDTHTKKKKVCFVPEYLVI